jgi:hypothetical protein
MFCNLIFCFTYFYSFQSDINELTEAEAKGFLMLMANREPGLVFDIMMGGAKQEA